MIVLIGATGLTGQIIAFKLHELGLEIRLAARCPAKLESLADSLGTPVEITRIDVTDFESIGPALRGAQVLINCAGPFTDLGEPLVKAALEHNIHYLDTTGEQSFIKLVYDRYSSQAISKNLALVPACAFEYALGDAAACLVQSSLECVDAINIFYKVSGFHASRGTKKSILKAIAAKGYSRESNQIRPMRIGDVTCKIEIDQTIFNAFSFPGGETFMLPLHMNVATINTFLALPLHPALFKTIATCVHGLMGTGLGPAVSSIIDTGSRGPTLTSRLASRFTLVCQGKNEKKLSESSVRGCDPYGLTAVIAAHIASSLAKEKPLNTGAISPTMVQGHELIIKATENAGTTWLEPGSSQF